MALIGDIGTRLRLPERIRLWQAAAMSWLRPAAALVQRLGLHHVGGALTERRRLPAVDVQPHVAAIDIVDHLALLVELVSSGWRGVDARLARLEAAQQESVSNAFVEKLPSQAEQAGAIVERAAA